MAASSRASGTRPPQSLLNQQPTGAEVSSGHGHFLLGGAEPLSHSRLQVGQPGHQSVDRPSGNLSMISKEGIDIAADALKRREDASSHLTPITEGLALRVVSHDDGGSSED
jgi:hypothetical protein